MRQLGVATWTLNFESDTPDDLVDGRQIAEMLQRGCQSAFLASDVAKHSAEIAGNVLDVKLVFFIRGYNERPHESEYGL